MNRYTLAQESRVDPTYLARLESGAKVHPGRQLVLRIGQALLDNSGKITLEDVDRLLKAAVCALAPKPCFDTSRQALVIPLPSPTATLPPPRTIAEMDTQVPTPTVAPIPTEPTAARLQATPTEGPAPVASPERTQVPTPAVISTVTPEPEAPQGGGCSAPASRFEHLDLSWALLGFMVLGLAIVRQ